MNITIEITGSGMLERNLLRDLLRNTMYKLEKLDEKTWNATVPDAHVDDVYEWAETHNITVRMV